MGLLVGCFQNDQVVVLVKVEVYCDDFVFELVLVNVCLVDGCGVFECLQVEVFLGFVYGDGGVDFGFLVVVFQYVVLFDGCCDQVGCFDYFEVWCYVCCFDFF